MNFVRIRPEQMAAFEADTRRDFERRVASSLRERFPEEWGSSTETELTEFVRGSERRANEYDLRTERAVVAVADIRTRIGDDWTAEPWDFVPRMLGDREYDPSFRAMMAAQLVHDLKRVAAGG